MATQRSFLCRTVQFCGRLWLLWFKVALCMSILSVLASVVQVTVSQGNMDDYAYDDDDVDEFMFMDEDNCTVGDRNCTELPADGICLNCTFNFDCTYGENTTVVCEVPDYVDCMGNKTFNRVFECQYCYQLQSEEDYCCAPNVNCKTRETPVGQYIANCTTRDHVTCLPPRNFQKQIRCNYASEYRWTTAILLSFTLGGFGVDRFYLNLWGSAIGKLVSFGGLGVWSILDIILIGTGYVGPADGSVYLY